MTLEELIRALPDPIEVVAGRPGRMDVRWILEAPDAPAGAAAAAAADGSLYLVADRHGFDRAVARFGGHVGIALLAPASAIRPEALARAGAATVLALAAKRVPLDLAARIQRALLEPASGGLTAGSVAAARQALIDDVLHGRFQDPQAVLTRARALGLDLAAARVVLVAAIDDFEHFYLRHEVDGEAYIQGVHGKMAWLVRQEVQRCDPRASVVPMGDAVVALSTAAALAREAAAAAAERFRRELRFVPVSIAVGSEKPAWTALSASHREAELALRLRKRLRWRARHVTFEQVTGYALLQMLEGVPEIRGLLETELGPLLEADRQHHTRLVETLAAWFEAGSSLKRAAEALNVHPKTLRYRLDRIGDLIGPDALSGEKRLLLYLAARWWLWVRG